MWFKAYHEFGHGKSMDESNYLARFEAETCKGCGLCVKRCPYDAITMERFEMQEISEDGRLYKESYRDTQLGLAGVGNQAQAGGRSSMTVARR